MQGEVSLLVNQRWVQKGNRHRKRGLGRADTGLSTSDSSITPPKVRRSKSATGKMSPANIRVQRSRSGSKEIIRKQATVVKAYSVQHPGDLELIVGQKIELTKSKGAWWEGICNGNKGIFPAKCVIIG